MRPITVGFDTVVPLDHYISPFNITIFVDVTGIVNYTVCYTTDNVFAAGYDPSLGVWSFHPDATAQSSDLAVNIAFPVTAVRVIRNSGAGDVTMTVIQAGQVGG